MNRTTEGGTDCLWCHVGVTFQLGHRAASFLSHMDRAEWSVQSLDGTEQAEDT